MKNFGDLGRRHNLLTVRTAIAFAVAITALVGCGTSNGNAGAGKELIKSEKSVTASADISKTLTKKNKLKKTIPKVVLTKNDQVGHAKKDLAKRLNLKIIEIDLLTSSPVTWRSSALGCPEPDKRYMQMLVPGMLFVFGANGKHYRYHGEINGLPGYCPNGRAESPSQSASDI